MKRILYDNKGSTLISVLFVLMITAVISSSLAVVFSASLKADSARYKREQALLYADAGLNIAYEYISKNKNDADFIKSLSGKSFKGKLDNIKPKNSQTELTYSYSDNNEFEISFELIDDKLKVTSKAYYMGVSANSSKYFYENGIDSINYEHYAVNSPESNINISGIADSEKIRKGIIRANNITIEKTADYESLYALGFIKSVDSGLTVQKDVMGLNSVEMENASVGGSIASAGYIKIKNVSSESLTAYGRKYADISKPDNVSILTETDDSYNLKYSLVLSENCSVGEIPISGKISDYERIAVYSDNNAFIDFKNTVIYGSIVVNGSLVISNAEKGAVKGRIIVRGDIIYESGAAAGADFLTETGIIKYDLDEQEFSSAVNGLYILSAKNIENKTGLYEKNPVTVFPDICNFDEQRTDSDKWLSHTESDAEYSLRTALRKEFDINNMPVLTREDSSSYDDGSVFLRNTENHNVIFIRINQSGRYVNLDKLLQITANPEVIIFIDAGLQNLDIALSGEWNLNNGNSQISRMIINDGSGRHKIRIFLEKGSVLNMKNNYPLSVTDESSGAVIQKFMEDTSNTDDFNLYVDDCLNFESSSDISDAESVRVPNLFIFSGGDEDDFSQRPKIILNTALKYAFRGYVLAPYANIDLGSPQETFMIGKMDIGNIQMGNCYADNFMVCSYPDRKTYEEAAGDVYFSSGSGGFGTMPSEGDIYF